MAKSTIIITGCDAFFYPYMEEALKSLIALGLNDQAEIGILDLGLDAAQLQALQAQGCIIRQPEWTLDVPEEIRVQKMLGLVARTALREYFPGFTSYVWFDADAWAQTPQFFTQLVEGAKAKGAAIIREDGTGYRRNMLYNRWWYGHMVTAYGPRGLGVAYKPAINIGIIAFSDTAPHWDAWKRHYQKLITQKKKLNLDQHAFNAAVEIERLPCALLPARCNWICTLSPPRWDREKKLFCEPNAGGAPLSVLHLAGPEKRRTYQLSQISGGTIATPVTYTAYRALA